MLEVFTVGGGDYLVNTFNAIAAWTGSGGFKSLIRVVMVMGLIYALLITAMDLDWRAWFRWFIQSTLIYTVLMVPTVTVKVTDRVNPGLAPATVANVPIGLAAMASFTSQISDYLTRTAETVFVMPAALNYSTGGFVYGARMWDKARGFEIRDPVFKANVDGYLKQCAYYDILLGTKSLKLLSEAPDLWAELGVNAATNRGMKYLTDTGTGTVDIEGKTCAQAWTLINNQWDNQINAYALPFAHTMYPKLTEAAAGAKLAADVPVVSQLLTGTAMTRNQFFKQKSMVDAFEAAQLDFGNADADSFALQRADTQTRNAMTTAAEQGLIWIPVLGVVLTVVFYALFPIVFPLLLFPRTGIATLKGYFSGFFYLSAWGPIYVLIHSFIMDRLASQTAAVSAGSVNLANWAGIDAVNQDIATMAGFLMLSVPMLALMVMRGTMSVANNLGSMLAPVQAGSDAAALERTTGNYAYGDVSYGNLNADNRQMSQWNQAPNLLAGAGHSGFREADGRMFNEYGSGYSVIDTNAAMSQLPFKPTMTRGYATDLRSQGQWYLNEADKIENGTSSSWTSSKGQFGSAVTATSDVSGARRESGSRASDTHNVGGNVVVEGAKGSSTREVTNNDLILREGNNRSSSDFSSRTFGSGLSLTGTGTVGTPLESEVGSGVSASLSGSLSGRRESGDNASAGSERSATNQTTRGTDKSDETSDRMVVSGSSGDIQSSGTYSQSSDYTDHSRSRTSTDGSDWRIGEAEERRAAAARYREIGSRMMSEASYAESHGFQISSDMSNLIQDRYETLQREHPEWHLPDLSNPRLDYRDVTRRDQAITYIMDDLMGDLRAHRIDELSDVAGIAGVGSLGTNADLGMPQTPALPSAPRTEGLVPSPLEGGTLLAVPDGPVDGAALARDLGIKVKPGARLGRMDGDLVPAMGVVAEEARSLGLPTPVVTSGNDSSQHMAGSAHYDDRALDFRGNNISDEQGERWASQVRSRLGDGYAVQFERFPDKPERDHLHVAKRRT
ncbi:MULTISPECIES: conjugal transfer protein TraG N-terminal domain-containing protein [Novosphingobium]|uniref:Conjugal transfer mating pair stabilization protein TraG n=1 Tax=Novosphingobium subterraneum TaxID=48936 RepID=A0A0B8ZVN6_9SPHN|nr:MULTISPECIES: conjugal transfer protein TraG N-terminal domain-containing protein [Novosphingobium]KHS42322.1 conjugal transfer mating pair stabilization protein TraG [Novosphingobium subterraneum]QOV96675.1 conjugal transfer protein TraG N-terminal domain-containing protein [Novosphingobium sp. ES2-1]